MEKYNSIQRVQKGLGVIRVTTQRGYATIAQVSGATFYELSVFRNGHIGSDGYFFASVKDAYQFLQSKNI